MKTLYFLIILSFLTSTLFSQQIKVGDRIPATSFQLFNFKKREATLADFKGKLVILDFGTLGCIPCVKLLPHVEELRKKFKDSIEIFWVVPSSKTDVENFFKTKRIAQGLDVPVIYASKQLWEQFEPQDWPYQVWIDKNGIIKARTNAEYLTTANISWMLADKPIDWVVYRQEQYNYKQPLALINQDVQTISGSSIPYYSFFLGHIRNLEPRAGILKDSLNNTIRTYLINRDMINAFEWLSNKFIFPFGFHRTRIVLNVIDTNRYVYYNTPLYKIEWLQKNTFSYEAVHPIQISDEERKNRIIKDLTAHLGIDVCFEKRLTKVYSIINKRYFPAVVSNHNSVNKSDRSKEWMSFAALINLWNNQYFQYPLIDKSGLDKIELRKLRWFTNEKEVKNISKLKKMLSDCGLDIIEDYEELELMIITEK